MKSPIAPLELILLLFSIAFITTISGIASATDGGIQALIDEQSQQKATHAQLSVIWSKTYGGSGQDDAYALIPIEDGYLMAGRSGDDACLVKTDLNGNEVWKKLYGGKGDDVARSVIAVDGGYIIAGSSRSYENFDVSDIYLLKTDLNGDMLWYKTFSYTRRGILTNAFGKAVIASDGGYVIVGETNADINGGPDIYLIKTDANGTQVWNRTYGGDADESGNAIIAVFDGYLVAGDTFSYGNGSSDIFLLKTDFNGDQVWNRTFGGKYEETANALAAVEDGYVIVGATKSHNNSKDYDIYLLKTGLDGSLIWSDHYGKADDDQGMGILPMADGYAITGYTSTTGNFYKDVCLLKTDLNGNQLWGKSYGRTDMDCGYALVQAGTDYVVAGYSCTYGVYTSDFYLLKIASDIMPTATPTVVPTETPTEIPPTTKEVRGLSGMDLGILVSVTTALIVVAGAGIFGLYYFFPKK